MSSSKQRPEAGFTIIELLISMTVLGVLTIASFTYFGTTTSQYLNLQKDGMAFNDLTVQSQRISKVLRGLTNISAATNDELTVYAYFQPDDTYVSQVKYYKNSQGTALYAEVTPMTANPPIGTLIDSQKKTFTIMGNFLSLPNVHLFDYLDSSGGILNMPIADLHTIKGITINLAVPINAPTNKGNRTMTSTVSLRNRKTNL